MDTPYNVTEILANSMESLDIPNKIRDFLAMNDGKRLDKRLMATLNKVVPGCELIHRFGMTNLVCGEHRFLMSHSEKNVVVDLKYFKEHNIAYFEAAEERNALRKSATPELIAELEENIELFRRARAKIKAMTAYGTCFSPDRCRIEKEYGIDE